jgi:hypothetical protein
MNEHMFEMSVEKGRTVRYEIRQQLIEAQMQEWPDSEILTPAQAVHRWLKPPPFIPIHDWCVGKAKFYPELHEASLAWSKEKEQHDLMHYQQTANAFACIIANDETVVFYECGDPDSHGRRCRGARFGVKGSQYMSGFPGGRT